MFGRVPAYTDISHLRAPYKNAYIAGFGQEAPPPPAPPPPPSNGAAITNGATTNGVSEKQFVETDSEGYRFVAPSARPTLMKLLEGYSTIVMGGTFNQVAIQPFTQQEIQAAQADPKAAALLKSRSARAWIGKQVAEDKVVFMSMPALVAILTGQPLPEGAGQLGTFPVGSEDAKEAARAPFGVVVAGHPETMAGQALAMLTGPIGIAAMAAVAVGGIYLCTRKRGRGGRRAGGGVPAMRI